MVACLRSIAEAVAANSSIVAPSLAPRFSSESPTLHRSGSSSFLLAFWLPTAYAAALTDSGCPHSLTASRPESKSRRYNTTVQTRNELCSVLPVESAFPDPNTGRSPNTIHSTPRFHQTCNRHKHNHGYQGIRTLKKSVENHTHKVDGLVKESVCLKLRREHNQLSQKSSSFKFRKTISRSKEQELAKKNHLVIAPDSVPKLDIDGDAAGVFL